MMLRRSDQWSNFWGDLSENGGYKRSFDYMDIVYHRRRGYWNVPYITGVVLIHRKIIHNLPRILTDNNWLDLDMRICHNLRECGIPMYVCNLEEYGWIIEDETNIPIPVQVLSRSVDLYDVVVRREEWEAKYLHPNYYQYRHNLTNMPYTELCPDIYNFPLFSHAFCTELIDIVEKYGKWSAGKNTHSDPRLGHNYYENYPTVDIQLFEVGLDRQWHEIVFTYIAPVAKIVYSSYKTKDINLAFVVKYTADNQASLDPHHDASTYTVNIALNESGTWYSGGGCRFIRQNYTLQNQLVGMCCMHPGRLTAYHEGLPVSHGTRYILVSFIN